MARRIGIVLFQLGGPDSLQSVRPFLYNLFCDPEIISLGPLGGIFRKPLAAWIAVRRAAYVSKHYAAIGGRSPISQLTERQARALADALRPQFDPTVVVAMRYWHPLTSKAFATLAHQPLDEIVLLPLYPQYSLTTTGSSFNEWNRVFARTPLSVPVRTIEHFYEHPDYLDALVEKINLALPRFDDPARVHFLFSAHGVPMNFIENGDPYQRHTEETVRLVMQRGAWPNAHSLCYQSRVGRQKWLAPSLHDAMERLPREGVKHLLVIPISFVTEHIETLYEVNIEAREEALHHGVVQFEMMPALGVSPRFISALADLVTRAVSRGASDTPAAHAASAH